jgi:dienelactone hydrolase
MPRPGLRPLLCLLVGALAAGGCAVGGPAPPAAAALRVDDADVLADEPVAVTVDGLVPGQEVALWARRGDDLGRTWLAYALFTADGDGRVDVGTATPVAGTYAGADPMGLFWSMRPADGAPPGPPVPVSAGSEARIALTAVVDGRVVAGAEVVQRSAAPGVVELPVREAGLVGTLHLPPGPGPHPGVVLLGGSEGGVPDYGIAGLLASRGFAALALGYFGVDGLPGELVRIPLEHFERGFDWLRARPEVGDGRVGVLGLSRGAELALLLGATFPQVGAVVSYAGSGLGYGGLPAAFTGAMPAAWTRGGRDVPFVAPAIDVATGFGRYFAAFALGAPVLDVAGTWPDVLAAGPAAMAAAEIPVERTDGPVLLLSGLDDRLWPSPQLSDVALRRLQANGHPHRHEHRAYPGAGHFFTGPPAGPFFTEVGSPAYGVLAGGGTQQAGARAAADSWPHVLDTLRLGLVGR